MRRKVKAIYTYFSEFPKEIVDGVIATLSEEHRDFIRTKISSNLEKNEEREITDQELLYFHSIIIPQITKKLSENTSNIIKVESTGKAKRKHTNSLTTKEVLNEMQEILTKPSFTTLLGLLTPKEALIFSLRLGISGKAFKASDIAEFLEIDVHKVYEITDKGIEVFQEYVEMALEKEQENLQELKLSIETASREKLAKRN